MHLRSLAQWHPGQRAQKTTQQLCFFLLHHHRRNRFKCQFKLKINQDDVYLSGF